MPGSGEFVRVFGGSVALGYIMGNTRVRYLVDTYSLIKLVHILSAAVLFGTGLGTAFFMLRTYLSGSEEAMAITIGNVVLADWVFTTPAVVLQLGTGLWLTNHLGIPLGSVWFATVISLFVIVGACWIPVVWIQIRIRNIIAGGGDFSAYRLLMRVWLALGFAAFTSVLILFFLMVTKPGTGSMLFT